MKFAVGLGPLRTKKAFVLYAFAVTSLWILLFSLGIVAFGVGIGFTGYFFGFLAGDVFSVLIIGIYATLREWEDRKKGGGIVE